MTPDIQAWNEAQGPAAPICAALAAEISAALPDASARLYHGAPVWFLNDNPITGYSVKKSGVQLLFWSGQSFPAPGLKPTGKYKAAEALYASAEQIDGASLALWLDQARKIQWDYANIIRRKGVLDWLVRPEGPTA